jgi:NADH:ubiquinone oxidoreductase subunit 5 (subunit L)/multisubunit Na+/H+ antiporter MnhA subunit
MQLSQVQSTKAPAWPVAGILWLGLGAVGAGVLAQPTFTKASGLALAIGLLTLFVAAIVATFSLRYMRADGRSTRFFVTLGVLVASVLAFLFTGNLIVLAAAWCASGFLLAGLIGHGGGWSEAEGAARRARRAFILGDVALVAALGLLGWHAGSWQVDAILAHASALPPLLANAAALLLVVAAAARCALPPFSGWLLSSMTAPTPVSALMHAGLVNAGGFLLIRFAPVLEAAPAARTVAVVLGLCGAFYGIGIMLVRPDVKRALAGSTVSQMGFMIMSCGLGAYAAALWHIIAHGLFKAWLFLGSGSTIGMKSGKSAATLPGLATLVIAAGTVGIALSILSFRVGDASLVPLLLGLATAVSTLVASLGGKVPMRAKVTLMLTLAALIVLHSAGLALAGMAIGPDAAPLVPEWVLVALLVVFLGAWAWQQNRVSTGRGLPLPLYVHLINAGALPAAGKGEE